AEVRGCHLYQRGTACHCGANQGVIFTVAQGFAITRTLGKVALTDQSPLNTATQASAQFPAPAYGDQETVFARAFIVLDDSIVARAFPAASIAVIHHQELVALMSFGRFTFEPASAQVTPSTIFDLASVTKVVATTTMAMLLYERGLLD